MFRSGRIGFWRNDLMAVKLQVYNPVQLYEFPDFRGRYEIFEKQAGFCSVYKIQLFYNVSGGPTTFIWCSACILSISSGPGRSFSWFI